MYIKRNHALSVIKTAKDDLVSDYAYAAASMLERYVEEMQKLPAADVAPVVHGEWIMTLYTTISKRGRVISNKKFACSECGYSNGRKQTNYCPNCGAKMDGGAEND